MITRIYVDNFGPLVNFELNLAPFQLLLGPNGSGKSTVFSVLRGVQKLLAGHLLLERGLFPADRLTRWQQSPVQRIELGLSAAQHAFTYSLTIRHEPDRGRARIDKEELTGSGKTLFSFSDGEVHLYRDDGSAGPVFHVDWSRSALGMVASGPDNTLLTSFRDHLTRVVVVAPAPAGMSGMSSGPTPDAGERMEQLASWYHFVSQDQGVAIRVAEALGEVLPGFSHFRFETLGEASRLVAQFSTPGGRRSYQFAELSDGQRMLAALYMLAMAAQDGGALFVDEPANNVALPEIGPWMDLVTDLCDDRRLQAVIISHHPLLIDRKAASAGLWLDREAESPTRVTRVSEDADAPLPLSRLVELGWLGVR
jgi:predicted ATPase